MYRYTDIKEDIAEELENLRDEGKALENVRSLYLKFNPDNFPNQELPKRISTAEEKEILSLLLKVHELEIDKVQCGLWAGFMQSSEVSTENDCGVGWYEERGADEGA